MEPSQPTNPLRLTLIRCGCQSSCPRNRDLPTISTNLSRTRQRDTESEAFIKVTRFQVPPVVPAGASIRLSCIYELRDETLHAMKLFKDDKEVSPREAPTPLSATTISLPI